MLRSAIALPVVVALGCSGARARSNDLGAPTARGAETVAGTPCSAEPPNELGATTLTAPTAPGATLSMRAPTGSVPLQGVADVGVALDVENAVLGADGYAVAVALDDRAPRRVESVSQKLRLGDLVYEDDAIEPGDHVIAAALVRASDGALAVVNAKGDVATAWSRFAVGAASAAAAADEPMLLLVEPRGTYNGTAAADHVVLGFAVLGRDAQRDACVRLAVLGPSVNLSYTLRGARSLGLRPLESGDYDVSAELVDASGRMRRAHRTIVVNRDAPSGEAP